jgi:hypothetical protein
MTDFKNAVMRAFKAQRLLLICCVVCLGLFCLFRASSHKIESILSQELTEVSRTQVLTKLDLQSFFLHPIARFCLLGPYDEDHGFWDEEKFFLKVFFKNSDKEAVKIELPRYSFEVKRRNCKEGSVIIIEPAYPKSANFNL